MLLRSCHFWQNLWLPELQRKIWQCITIAKNGKTIVDKLPTMASQCDSSYCANYQCMPTLLLYILQYSNHWFSGLTLTSSISGRNACLSEEVTFTCTADGDALFWRNEAFEEISMHYTSSHNRGEDFRAEIVSYDRNQSCLVSSLSFHATVSRNGTTVTCTNRDRSSSQSLSLHIMSSEYSHNYVNL